MNYQVACRGREIRPHLVHRFDRPTPHFGSCAMPKKTKSSAPTPATSPIGSSVWSEPNFLWARWRAWERMTLSFLPQAKKDKVIRSHARHLAHRKFGSDHTDPARLPPFRSDDAASYGRSSN